MQIITKQKPLSGNALKIIAAFFMLIDHIGYIIYPQYKILRIIGRLSFPIFAFMIAEGCHYTKNKLKYFLRIFSVGVLCQIFYYFYDGSTYMGIFVTFSISILLIYLLQYCKEQLFSPQSTLLNKIGSVLIFSLAVVAVYLLNTVLHIDYGFWGCMVPVLSCAFQSANKKEFNLTGSLIAFGLGLAILSIALGGIQFYSLLALPLLFLYSGKRGKANVKLFFYIFYPAHLVILQMISMYLLN